MNKNEFITVTAYHTGITRYININHITQYYKDNNRTQIDLTSGKWFCVRETCEEIEKKINEVLSK